MNDLLSQSSLRSSADFDAHRFDSFDGSHTPSAERNLAFHAAIALLASEMEKVRDLLKKLQQANDESKGVTNSEAMKRLRERMDRIAADVVRTAKLIKAKLDTLDKENYESRKIPGCEEGTATDRMRFNVTNRQRVTLVGLMNSFDKLRQQMKSDQRTAIERRYITIMGEKPSEEIIDQMIETGESETFLQKAVQGKRKEEILNAMKEIQERHDTLKEIEKSLLELHQVFGDISVLVDDQGVELKSVNEALNGARSFIRRGSRRIASAKKLHKNTRKWKCCCCCL